MFIIFAAAAHSRWPRIGIYGFGLLRVSQRTHEIGLRVAIGATRSRIVLMILGQGLRVAHTTVFVAAVIAASATTRFRRACSMESAPPIHEPSEPATGLVLAARDIRDVRPRMARLANRCHLLRCEWIEFRCAGRRIRIE